MDVPTLIMFLSLILTVASVQNNGEIGDIYDNLFALTILVFKLTLKIVIGQVNSLCQRLNLGQIKKVDKY